MANQPLPKNHALVLERYEYRLVYSKTGRAKYISHLDLMRAMQRAFKRARIPLWYTQGFNPHAYLMFPLALALGTESSVEILDIALIEKLDFNEIKDRLNENLPEGLKIISVSESVMKHTEISSAQYKISIKSTMPASEIIEKFNDFISRETIEIEKMTKRKKVKIIDIKPHINLLNISESGNRVVLDVILPTGSELNLNTSVVIDAFSDIENIDIVDVCTQRTKIMAKNGECFI